MFDFFSSLTKKKKRILLQYSLFRWENAVLLAGGSLLTFLLPVPFLGWPVWGWLALSSLGVLTVTGTSLTNPGIANRLLLDDFQGKYKPALIQDQELRRDVEMAMEYQRRIEARVRNKQSAILWDSPEGTANQLEDWIETIYQLALRLDAYRRDDLLTQQRGEVPKALANRRARREKEKNQDLQKESDLSIESTQKQWDALQALDFTMKKAEIQLEQSLAALATINSQVGLIEAQDADTGRAGRIRSDIQEQVNRLNDLVTSINEVYNYHTKGIG
jgi:hypothetical protein